jgi:hypothetical protein
MLRRQIGTLEQSVWEIAGHEDAAADAQNLLTALAAQRQQLGEARATLEAMQTLHEQLRAETSRTQQAMDALCELTGLKQTLLDNAGRAQQAVRVWEVSEELCQRLARHASTAEVAAETGDSLLQLGEDLLSRGGEAWLAKENLQQLIDIRRSLDEQGADVETARENVDGLLSLKDTIIAQTSNLADAIETLELTADLGRQFHETAMSFDRIRHWMVEMVAMEPLFERARHSLEPLTELGNLRRLDFEQLREMARLVGHQHRSQLARKPVTTPSTVSVSDLHVELAPTAAAGDSVSAP